MAEQHMDTTHFPCDAGAGGTLGDIIAKDVNTQDFSSLDSAYHKCDNKLVN